MLLKILSALLLALFLGHGSAAACSSSEGYAWDTEGIIIAGRGDYKFVRYAEAIASELCDIDSDKLNFATKIAVIIHMIPNGFMVVQVTSLKLSEALENPETMKNLATIYGGNMAFQLENFQVSVGFFHFRADDSGKARAVFVLTIEEGELKVERAT